MELYLVASMANHLTSIVRGDDIYSTSLAADLVTLY